MQKETGQPRGVQLSEFEERVLMAVLEHGENAYGVRIRQSVEQGVGRTVSIGALYVALDRLEQRGLLASSLGEATAERGGKAKRFYSITGVGRESLRSALNKHALIGLNLERLLGGAI